MAPAMKKVIAEDGKKVVRASQFPDHLEVNPELKTLQVKTDKNGKPKIIGSPIHISSHGKLDYRKYYLEKCLKIEMVGEYYDIDRRFTIDKKTGSRVEDPFRDLCMKLLNDFVPGFSINVGKAPGRPKNADADQFFADLADEALAHGRGGVENDADVARYYGRLNRIRNQKTLEPISEKTIANRIAKVRKLRLRGGGESTL